MKRLIVLVLLLITLVILAIVPSAMTLNAAETELWYVIGWIVAPVLAGLVSFRAAGHMDGSACKAWRNYGLGCTLWAVGIVIWAAYGWHGVTMRFPCLADFFFIFSNVLFALGALQYSLEGTHGSRILVTNFAVALFATFTTGLSFYLPILIDSDLGLFGTAVAVAYPVVGLSTWVFALICYCLYIRPGRRLIFALILTGLAANAVANFFYGMDVLNQDYFAGTFYDVFWIAGFAFLAWAAVEQTFASPVTHVSADGLRLTPLLGHTLVPAISTAAVLLAGMAHVWNEPGIMFLLLPILGFAGSLAIREHVLFTTERALRSQAEETARRLAESEARLSGVLETTTDGVLVLDREFRITFANLHAINQLFKNRPYLGIPLWQVLGSSRNSEFYHNYRVAFEQQTPLSFEAYFPPMNRWFEDHVFPTPDSLTIFFRDVTERRRLREELVRQAQHDPLTALANRALFAERLATGLQSGRRPSDLILVMIDLDDFKAINDSLGHLAGDTLVKQFARRLAGLVRQGDTVARFGGDEFAIVQPGPVEPDGGVEIARRINESLKTSFAIHGQEVALTASIGIAIAPQHGARPDDLIRSADLALYRAKANKCSGPNYCIFDAALDEPLDARRSQGGMSKASA